MVFSKFTAAFHKIKIFSVTVFLILSSPIILLIVLTFSLYRKAVSTSVKLFRKDLDTFISPRCSLYASDDLYGIPDWNVVSCLVVKGQLCLSILQNLVNERIVNSTESDGEFSYPTLRQFPYPWGGYWWFKWDQKFDICNHVYVYEKARDTNRVWNENDLVVVQKNLLRKQWRRQRSLWEIFLINNFKASNSSSNDQKCILFIRYHQSLSVGNEFKSWMTLLSQELCESSTPTSILRQPELKKNKQSVGFFRKAFDTLSFPFKVTHNVASEILEPGDENPWKVKDKELIKRDQLILEKFSKQFIIDIKTSHKVSFSGVALAAVSGAVRLTLLEMGLQVPASMRVMYPIRVNTDDSPRRNNISPCFIKLPLGIANGKERLMTCQSHLRQLHDSIQPFTNLQIMSFAGSLLPLQWASKLFKNRVFLCTGLCTTIHGPDSRLKLMGQDVEDFIVSCASGSGFVFTFLSYGEAMRVTAVIDQRLIPSDVIGNKFMKNLYNELSILGDIV